MGRPGFLSSPGGDGHRPWPVIGRLIRYCWSTGGQYLKRPAGILVITTAASVIVGQAAVSQGCASQLRSFHPGLYTAELYSLYFPLWCLFLFLSPFLFIYLFVHLCIYWLTSVCSVFHTRASVAPSPLDLQRGSLESSVVL